MTQTTSKLSRRTLFAGATTAGAVATVASLLPALPQVASPEVQAKPAPANGGGYSLSAHVQRYYQTTRV